MTVHQTIHVPADDAPRVIQWHAVFRGATAGLFFLVLASVIEAILDRNIDTFNDSGWIYPLFVLILFGYMLGGFGAGRLVPRGRAQQRPARGHRRVRALDPGPDRDLAGPRREPGPLHRPLPRPAPGPDLRPPPDRRRARHVRRLPRRPLHQPRPLLTRKARALARSRRFRDPLDWSAQRVGRVAAGQRDSVRGTSGLHRARCWVTPSRGDPQDSATESRPPMATGPRIGRTGKGETVR